MTRCFACKDTTSPLTGLELRKAGWHDVSRFVDEGRMGDVWLCPNCVHDSVQCARCDSRQNADAARVGHGYDRFVGVEITGVKPWQCVGERWEWVCASCVSQN